MSKLLEQRGQNYGDFSGQASISQGLKDVARKGVQYDSLKPFQKESVEMILHKIARIVNGNPNYIDSWKDIIGYLQLVVDKLNKTDGATDSQIVKIVIKNGNRVKVNEG